MRAEDIIDLLRLKPFVPLRVHMADGTKHEIPLADMALVHRLGIDIGIPSKRRPEIAERVVFCHLPDVVRIEKLDGEYPPPIN